MKKLISLFLTFAMLFSLAMPAMAAEGDSLSTIYIDVGQLENAELVQSVWIWTRPNVNVNNEPMTHVSGTIYSYDISAAVAAGDTLVEFATISGEGGTLGDYYTAGFEAGKNLWIATGERTGTWSVYGDSPSAPIINGNTTGDVTASYTPTAKITGLYITVDGVEYNNENTSADAPATVYSDSIVTVTVYGENFANLPEDISPEFAFIYFGANIEELYKNNTKWTIDTESNTATITAINSILAKATAASELKYTNDMYVTEPGSGVYVIYNEGTKPTTPDDNAEAKWGTSKDELTGSGTLAEAIAAAENNPSITYIQLQDDVTTDDGYDIGSGVFTLDLNGKTLTSSHYCIAVHNFAAQVTLIDTATGGEVISTGSGAYAVCAFNGGKLVIDGGSYSGPCAVYVMYGSAEITDGTFTSTSGYAVSVERDSTLTIDGGTFFGGRESVVTSGTTTIKGGTFAAGIEGHIAYYGGTLDLSDYTGDDLTLSQWTGSDLTVSDETIKLPEGYAFKDGKGNNVTTLVYGTIYTIGVENTEPTYTITVDTYGEGTVEVPSSAAEGDTVTVELKPADGYTGLNFRVMDAENYSLHDFTKVNETTYTFVMPAVNVLIIVDFCLPGTTLDTIYYKGPWTNVRFELLNSAGLAVGVAVGTIVEDGIYSTSPIPEWTYMLVIRNLDDESQYIGAEVIPTDGRNMYNAETGQWETYTPSQPPEDVTSAEITWGSMSFTYDDTIPEGKTEENGWSNDGSEGAGTVTVKNTGKTTFIAQAAYTAVDEYTEIEGVFDVASAELAAEASKTFTLTLNGKPNKAIPAGTKIGEVTITINKSAEG